MQVHPDSVMLHTKYNMCSHLLAPWWRCDNRFIYLRDKIKNRFGPWTICPRLRSSTGKSFISTWVNHLLSPCSAEKNTGVKRTCQIFSVHRHCSGVTSRCHDDQICHLATRRLDVVDISTSFIGHWVCMGQRLRPIADVFTVTSEFSTAFINPEVFTLVDFYAEIYTQT